MAEATPKAPSAKTTKLLCSDPRAAGWPFCGEAPHRRDTAPIHSFVSHSPFWSCVCERRPFGLS